MARARLGQRGFNLTNIVVSMAVVVLVIGGTRYYGYLKHRQAGKERAEQRLLELRRRLLEVLETEAAWKFTLRAPENPAFSCFRDKSSCEELKGPFALRDSNNRNVFDATKPTNGFSLDGSLCANFSERGSDTCPFRADLEWQARCSSNCSNFTQVNLSARIRFRPDRNGDYGGIELPDAEFKLTRLSEAGEPRNCSDHRSAGRTGSGVYLVRPDPARPAFSVYCDQTRDGGGWALVISAPTDHYQAIPESHSVSLLNTGRLPAWKIRALMAGSEFQLENNFRMELPTIDGGLILSASSGGLVEPGRYTARMPPGGCRSVLPVKSVAEHEPGTDFSLRFEGAGEAAFEDRSVPIRGYLGFHACFGDAADGHRCGQGCGRIWKGEQAGLKGYLWVR